MLSSVKKAFVLDSLSTAPSMAKGTTSVESASRAEKAATARPEVLEPRA